LPDAIGQLDIYVDAATGEDHLLESCEEPAAFVHGHQPYR